MRLKTILFLGLTGVLLGTAGSYAQTPLGPEFRANEQGKHPQGDQVIGVAESGEFLVVWQGRTEEGSRDGLWGQWFSSNGQPSGHNRALEFAEGQFFQPAAGPGLRGGVSVYWRESRRPGHTWDWDNLVARDLSSDNTWRSPKRKPVFLGQLAPRFVRPLPQGGQVVALIGSRPGRREARTFLLFTDPEGNVIRGPIPVYPARRSGQYVGGLAVSPSGEVLVTWSDYTGRSRVLAQLFSPEGRPLRGPVQVHDNVPGAQFTGRTAALGDQGYVVVWNDEEDVQTGRSDLKMRFLNPDGTLRGPVLRVNEDESHRYMGEDLTADAAGNFFVVWDEGGDVWGRLFRPDGRPVGPGRILNRYTLSSQEFPIVATGVNGTFIVAWRSYGQDGDEDGIFGQVFAASPADEVCALGAGRLRCDLARSGGAAELERRLPFGEQVLGDWDGDGREDLCRFEAGDWRCDLDHFGAPFEAVFTFGQSGDRPLLGDVNGDGRADACVRRGTRLLCDTMRDGAATSIEFGAEETLSLADVDGDGQAEACTLQGARFLCDTGHDGGAFEWERSFGSGADVALFGDADGDGKDEPCLHRGGELLCDTAQNGGEAEMRLSFPLEAGERLVLLNLDGL